MTKLFLIGAGVLFALALVYIVGSRLSNEALAVVIGAICGIMASIPVCIGIVYVATGAQTVNPTPRAPSAPLRVICEHGIDVAHAMCFECAQRGQYTQSAPIGARHIKEIGDRKR